MRRNQPEMICQSTLLSLGFTKSMINKLLPEPKLVPNPHYKCSAPMRLWEKEKVLSVMDSDEYANLLQKAEKRKAAGKQSYNSRIINLQNNIKDLVQKINLEVIPDDELIRKMQESRIAHYTMLEEQFEYDNDEEMDLYFDKFSSTPEAYVMNADEETTNRWIVNYIRHEMINYDFIASSLRGMIGGLYGYVILKLSILKKISETYPKYAMECKRQSDMKFYTEDLDNSMMIKI